MWLAYNLDAGWQDEKKMCLHANIAFLSCLHILPGNRKP